MRYTYLVVVESSGTAEAVDGEAKRHLTFAFGTRGAIVRINTEKADDRVIFPEKIVKRVVKP